MSTDEHQASIDRLREELFAMIMAQMEDLRKQIDEVSNHQLSWWYGGEPLKAV